jgi:hypothetical protein
MGSIPIPPSIWWLNLMTNEEILNIYMLYSENVRALSKAKDGMIKDINFQIRRSDNFQVSIKTKMLALMYSTWSEAQFLQIAHTPNGFMYTEIVKIKGQKKRFGIANGWHYMLKLALQKVGDKSKSKDLERRLETLLTIVEKYIEEPSIIRNKIAHGQWVVALNRENTSKNEHLTDQLEELDPIIIEKRFEIHKFLGFIVRDLVQSPKAGFHKHYWTNIVNLETFMKKTQNWSLESKREKLIIKPITYTKPN